MSKKRISRGNNLGNSNSLLMENFDFDNLYYDENLLSILERDVYFQREYLFNNSDFIKFIHKNSEFKILYNNWFESLEAQNIDVPYEVILNKQLEIDRAINDGVYTRIWEEGKQKIKEQYTPFIENVSNLLNYSKNGDPKRLEFENGKAILNGTYLTHGIPISDDIDGLLNRKELGILPSEWFGIMEKYGECRFCSSFTKKNNFDKNEFLDASIEFIVDTTAPEMQYLLHLDFFEYTRNKTNGNLISYTQDEIDFLETINSLSPSGSSAAKKRLSWCAIPGGLPSKYIVGIMTDAINKDQPSQDFIIKASEIFQVPVIDSELNLVYQNSQTLTNDQRNLSEQFER
ncbi:MAG: hypothetical protein IJ301_05200 [Clostridia bacterium]|nr:hypothetical protein [Clostridia bacterium]